MISGPPASGKTTIAEALAKDCNMPKYSAGGELKAMYEKFHPKKDIPFREWWRQMSIEDNRKLDERLKVEFESNRLVADSRYTSYLDKTKCLLVFVNADIETRSLRALLRDEFKDVPREKVAEILKMREEDEVKTGIELFGVDYRDTRQYHIIINSDLLSIKQEVNAIKGAFESKTIRL